MEANTKEKFLLELDDAIKWDTRWEISTRILFILILWVTWMSRLLLLVFSGYLFNYGYNTHIKLVSFCIVFFSMLNISLPLLSDSLRLQQRQQVYDKNWRKFSAIRDKVIYDLIPLERAVEEFNQIHEEPTELIIRNTP